MVRRNNVAPGGNEVRMIGSAYRDDRIRERGGGGRGGEGRCREEVESV